MFVILTESNFDYILWMNWIEESWYLQTTGSWYFSNKSIIFIATLDKRNASCRQLSGPNWVLADDSTYLNKLLGFPVNVYSKSSLENISWILNNNKNS